MADWIQSLVVGAVFVAALAIIMWVLHEYDPARVLFGGLLLAAGMAVIGRGIREIWDPWT